jgi:hypothetical protein
MAQDRGRDAHCWVPLRTDPDRPDSSIRFLPRVFDGEALIGPGMTDTRCGKAAVGQFRHSIPSEAVLLGRGSDDLKLTTNDNASIWVNLSPILQVTVIDAQHGYPKIQVVMDNGAVICVFETPDDIAPWTKTR